MHLFLLVYMKCFKWVVTILLICLIECPKVLSFLILHMTPDIVREWDVWDCGGLQVFISLNSNSFQSNLINFLFYSSDIFFQLHSNSLKVAFSFNIAFVLWFFFFFPLRKLCNHSWWHISLNHHNNILWYRMVYFMILWAKWKFSLDYKPGKLLTKLFFPDFSQYMTKNVT